MCIDIHAPYMSVVARGGKWLSHRWVLDLMALGPNPIYMHFNKGFSCQSF